MKNKSLHTIFVMVCAICAVHSVCAISMNYRIIGGEAWIGDGESVAINQNTSGTLVIPSSIGDYPVTHIDRWAFYGCRKLTAVLIPETVSHIGYEAFAYCCGLTSVTLPEGVTSIGDLSFLECKSLKRIVVPASVTQLGSSAFASSGLTNIVFYGNAPTVGNTPFQNVGCVVTVYRGTTGWDDDGDGRWCGRTLEWKGLTESETRTWVGDNAEHSKRIGETAADYRQRFETKFGNDYSTMPFKQTGKVGAGGTQLCVWHDYVAGTDPLDENDVFKASVAMVEMK